MNNKVVQMSGPILPPMNLIYPVSISRANSMSIKQLKIQPQRGGTGTVN